jgi:drug/metabolite transporter (DMT)-like permease
MPRILPAYYGALLVLLSAAGFSTLAIFIKIAYAAGVNVLTLLALRFTICTVCLLAILNLRQKKLSVSKKLAVQLFLMGSLGYGTTSLLFTASLSYLPASLSAMLLYTYPAIVSLLSFMMGDDKLSLIKGLALTICFGGLFLVLGVSFTSINLFGSLLVLAAAVIYSIYIVAGNRILKNVSPLVSTTHVCLSASLVFLMAGLFSGELSLQLSPVGWLAILGIAIFATLFGILFFFAGLSRIGATNAAIISTVEPVLTVIMSALLLDEKITLVQTSGGVLILAGILLLQLWAGKNNR